MILWCARHNYLRIASYAGKMLLVLVTLRSEWWWVYIDLDVRSEMNLS